VDVSNPPTTTVARGPPHPTEAGTEGITSLRFSGLGNTRLSLCARLLTPDCLRQAPQLTDFVEGRVGVDRHAGHRFHGGLRMV
jgi:hypothetical protein